MSKFLATLMVRGPQGNVGLRHTITSDVLGWMGSNERGPETYFLINTLQITDEQAERYHFLTWGDDEDE